MELRKHFETSGQWLFRWRSYLPAFLILPLPWVLSDFHRPYGQHDIQEFWVLFCIAVTGLGLLIRAFVAGFVPRGTSGRNTKQQVATSLNTTGVYSLCRHPLYLGNFFVALGWVLFFHNAWFISFYVMTFWLYYERIMMTEEAFLREKFGNEFLTWADRTSAFLPSIKNWKQPALRFSFRTIIRREYLTFVGAMLVFVILELIEHGQIDGKFLLEPLWIALAAVTGLVFITVRSLHKFTSLLVEEGR
tara:strand:- start:94 stop:834 length:741 start_codon:yes stop_codon:yes gene_type:complete